MSAARDQYTANQVAQLLAFAERKRDQGVRWTHVDGEQHLGVRTSRFRTLLTQLRAFLSQTGQALPCVPDGKSADWLYGLTMESEPVRWWHAHWFMHGAAEAQSWLNMVRSRVQATEPDTLEGFAARMLERSLQRVCEDIATLLTFGGGPGPSGGGGTAGGPAPGGSRAPHSGPAAPAPPADDTEPDAQDQAS